MCPESTTVYAADTRPLCCSRIIKYADDTTVAGLVRYNNHLSYGEKVIWLMDWCCENNLILNVEKTKEMIAFRWKQPSHLPLFNDMMELRRRLEAPRFWA